MPGNALDIFNKPEECTFAMFKHKIMGQYPNLLNTVLHEW